MSDTKKKNPAIACADLQYDERGNKISVEQGNYGPSKNEINSLAGMKIQVEGYEIIKDEKTGKILRIKDNRTINEVIDDKHRRMIEAALKKKEEKEQEAR